MLGMKIAITGLIVLALLGIAVAQISPASARRMSSTRAGLVLLPVFAAAAAVVVGLLMAVWGV